jgi:hypothetical protein
MDALWNVLGSFGILFSLIWLVAASMRLHLAIQAGQEAVKTLDQMTKNIEAELQKVAENKTSVRREIEQMEEVRGKGRQQLEALEADLTPEAMAKRTRYYVLADRRSVNDQAWVTTVANNLAHSRPWHPWYIESWRLPRHYVSWAANADAARRLAESKFPATAGFVLGQTSLLPDPKPAKT